MTRVKLMIQCRSANVQPYFECFRLTGRSSTAYTAYLSWNNRESNNVVVLKDSPRNKFTGFTSAPLNQPDLFKPGVSR